MTIQKLIVSVRKTDGRGRDVAWPYEHVPRVGETFSFASGLFHAVSDVQYKFVDGGAFHALVIVEPTEAPG